MIGTLMARKAIAGGFEALNQHDLAQFMAGWRDDGVFIYPGDISESGTFQGKSAVEAWFRRFFERFPEIQYDLQAICVRDLFDLAGNNVAAAQWDCQLTNREGRTGQMSGVSVITIQGSKVCAVQDFVFDLGDEFRRVWGEA